MSAQMLRQLVNGRGRNRVVAIIGFVFSLTSLAVNAANLANLTVKSVARDTTQTPPATTESDVPAYRWLVEEDKSYHVQTLPDGSADQTTFDPNWDQGNDGHPGGETLSVAFHRSHMPVVAKGCVGFGDLAGSGFTCNELAPVLKPDTHYYVSVVPRSGGSIGGASFVTDGSGNVPPTTVYVNEHPMETAQITVLVFHDNAPLNNAPDLPTEEPGLGPDQTDMTGFQILVEDAGGRYGASAGMQSQDAFGNPLGTTYDAAGNVTGFQPLITGPDGRLTIKNLAPGKYGIQAVPPTGDADLAPHGNFPGPEDIDRNNNRVLDSGGWQQTSTIEGTKVIDAWVKAGEPPYFAEFGPPGFHVFIGFVEEFNAIPAGGAATITGTVVNQHLSRPPDYAFYNGTCFGHTTPWVGLNSAAGVGPALFAAPTDESCGFSIPNVPDGDYQLVVWDNNLDLIFAFKSISIANGACNTPTGCALGDVPVFQWFHRQEHRVFDDLNANGVWDPGEGPSAPEQAFNLRWRDGTINQANVSDGSGAYAFDQVFPFFSWLVAEVDFLRFQATGLTAVIDNGGAINLAGVPGPAPLDGNDITFGGAIALQDQENPADPSCGPNLTDPCTESANYRVERGPVLTQGFQGFIGQTNAFLWGKRHYPDDQNGGISGIVFYAVTRAENDPEKAGAEVWEPGIPGVTVNLYDATGTTLLATTTTDSWDDSIPTGCKYGDSTGTFQFDPDGAGGIGPFPQDCYDGLRVFNQARPAVFDGGYAFGPEIECPDGTCPTWVTQSVDNPNVGYMKPGDYVVQVVPPPGYEIVKPEDKNVDFGDEYQPSPLLLAPPCVGTPTLVPAVLTMFPDQAITAPFAGTSRPLCDKKLVTLSGGANAAADFFLFTEVPIAAHGFGFILDDTTAEFDPNSPQFGEKYAPPFVPVTVRDFTGRVIGKTLSDQYGRYNFLAPSTITANLPQPSGMSPNMLTTCMNDPGDDPSNPDPNWNQQYSTFCYTFQYMPGTTTYLDTPVVPVAAFTGPDQYPLDCEYPDGTPRIYSVDVQTNGVGGGPYIPAPDPSGPSPAAVPSAQTVVITSMGSESVPNPGYCNPAAGVCPPGADTVNRVLTRDYGFGSSAGTVSLAGFGDLSCASWSDADITCTVPAGPVPGGQAGGRQLTVTRANGQATKVGVTVQVGLRNQGANGVVVVEPSPDPRGTPITDAILASSGNALILVKPGNYNEMVIMSKPVQLQGWGEGSTIINAIKAPADKLAQWRTRVDSLVATGAVDLLPGQEVGPGTPEPVTLWDEEGAGVLVLAPSSGGQSFDASRNRDARIDGFTIKGADTGGGVIANGYADYLEVSNNRISNNTGFYGGGIRVGHPFLTDADNLAYIDADNDFVRVHHNQVVFNGGQGGAGAGISMGAGSDAYQVTQNWVCGNFSARDGGGIGHIGVSDGTYRLQGGGQNRRWVISDIPLIADNTVVFNESFFQGQTVSGGGIVVSGAPPLTPGAFSPGAGNVVIDGNLVLGNSAGAGDGGGIRLAMVNGLDVVANPTNQLVGGTNLARPWYRVNLFNNMIVNNVAGLAGGGISLQDAVNVHIVHNTIASNDSLATAGAAFTVVDPATGNTDPNRSMQQPGAGVVSRAHSGELARIPGATVGAFSNPTAFADNIVWQNRQFYFWVDTTSGCTPGDTACTSTFGLCPDLSGALACPGGNTVVYNDLGVIGAAGTLACDPGASCILTGGEGVNPLFVTAYANGARSAIVQPEINTVIQAPPAFDEGGNFIKPTFGPLSLTADVDGVTAGVQLPDYHVQVGSAAVNSGTNLNATYPALSLDFDGGPRPAVPGSAVDIGADELQ